MTRSRPHYHQMLVSARLGGGEKLAIEIQRFLGASRPGTGELLVPAGAESARFVAEEGLPWRSYRLDRLLARRRLPWLAANAELLAKLRHGVPGILHVHSPFVYGALRPLLTLTRLRTILHLHLDYSEEQLRWPLRHPPHLVITCASFMRERVAKVLADLPRAGTRIQPVINGVDTERFKPAERSLAKRRYGLAADRPLLLMTANLAPHKGQETAIRAVALLKDRGYDPLLWVVGEEREAQGVYAERLRQLVQSLALARHVTFLGFRNDVPELLQAADALLLPSTSEGLPLAILEAQAAKVAVLAAPTAGIPEVIADGRTGCLIAADDPEGYAKALESLLREPCRASEMVEAAHRQVVSGFSLRQYCQKILGCYDQLLETELAT